MCSNEVFFRNDMYTISQSVKEITVLFNRQEIKNIILVLQNVQQLERVCLKNII